jgi:hypothetical protein
LTRRQDADATPTENFATPTGHRDYTNDLPRELPGRPFGVIGANMQYKLFVSLQLKVAHHFVERLAGGLSRGLEPPATFRATKTTKTRLINPYQLPAHGRLCRGAPMSTRLLSRDETFWFAIDGSFRSGVLRDCITLNFIGIPTFTQDTRVRLERVQAGCQCRATSGDSFNGIVFGKLRGTGQLGVAAIRGTPVARFHQDGGFQPCCSL